ncbi:MAG: ATP-binding protein [Synechococcus sp.]
MVVSLSTTSVFETIQNRLGDRFKPFLARPETLRAASRALTDWVAQTHTDAIVLIRLPDSSVWSEEAPYYESLSRSTRAVYILSPESLFTAASTLFCCKVPNNKHQQEEVLALLTPDMSCILVGQQLNDTHSANSSSHCVTYFSYGAEALDPALTILQQLASTARPQLQKNLRKGIEELAPRSPSPDAAAALIPQLIQLLDSAIQQKQGLQRQAQNIEELQQNNAELKQALEFKDGFMKTVSQQLCNPLTNIKTAIQLLRSPRIKEGQKARYWNVLQSECDHQASLINSLMELTAIEESSPELDSSAVALFDLVPGVVSTYQAVAQEKGIMLAYTVPSALPKVNFPASSLKTILVKLIENGIQCTLDGGKIWVIATANGQYIQVEVRDTGIGIPPDSIPKLFDRFYRVPRAKMHSSGVGLGLTVVQTLLLQAGGAISVRSQMGLGTTFTLMLPQADASVSS